MTHFCGTVKVVTQRRDIRANLYLRLSDLRDNGEGKTFEDRERKLRDLANWLGWTVVRVVIENDLIKGRGKRRIASAFKRRKIILADGSTVYRVWRPGFRSILDDFRAERANALLAEDLDRTMRDPRDMEDFIDVAAAHKINARSLSGSLTFTDGGTDAEITMARFMVTIANKYSRDNQRRALADRESKAMGGRYGGGARPFGFESDGITGIPVEAKVIEVCVDRILQGVSLRALAAELRAGDVYGPIPVGVCSAFAHVPTVTGVPWTATTLRAILLRPRNAGLMVHQGVVVGKAPWGQIVPPDVHDAVVSLFTDPARNTNAGAAPRWFGSGIYLCGVCDDGTTCQVTEGDRRVPRYRCKKEAHLTRNARYVDDLVTRVLIGRLSRPDAADLFARPRPDVNVAALRTESRAIRTNLDELAADRALGLVDRTQMIKATKRGRDRLDAIGRVLAEAAVESPLAGLVGAEDVAAVWDALPLATRRIVLDTLVVVIILPTGRTGRGFDPTSVRIDWKASLE